MERPEIGQTNLAFIFQFCHELFEFDLAPCRLCVAVSLKELRPNWTGQPLLKPIELTRCEQ